MFHRSRRHRSPADKLGATDPGGAEIPAPQLQPGQHPLQEWRESAQRVTHAWNGWLSAERQDRPVRYRAFVAALADEERAAAEVERIVALADAGQSVITTPSAPSHPARPRPR